VYETLYFHCRALDLCYPERRSGVRSDEEVGADGALRPAYPRILCEYPSRAGGCLDWSAFQIRAWLEWDDPTLGVVKSPIIIKFGGRVDE
jgi:hypothetical protein